MYRYVGTELPFETNTPLDRTVDTLSVDKRVDRETFLL
jgi:hypothetical protein